MTKKQKIIYYVLSVLVSGMFLLAAYAKLSDNPGQEMAFTIAHLPIWFMYFIGVCELAGVIGLWIPKLSVWACYGLLIIMAGATIVTAVFVSVPKALFPIIVALCLGIIMRLRKKRSAMVTTTATAQ
jgi:putative oxidoreductase